MKALTLHAAWAYAVRSLGKRIENRTWAPPAALIGQRIAIHAGQRVDEAQLYDALRRAWAPEERGELLGAEVHAVLDDVRDMRGLVIGTAVLAGTIRPGDVPGPLARRWWQPECVGWLLADFRPSTVGPVRGAQGLWTLPAGLAAELEVRDAA